MPVELYFFVSCRLRPVQLCTRRLSRKSICPRCWKFNHSPLNFNFKRPRFETKSGSRLSPPGKGKWQGNGALISVVYMNLFRYHSSDDPPRRLTLLFHRLDFAALFPGQDNLALEKKRSERGIKPRGNCKITVPTGPSRS